MAQRITKRAVEKLSSSDPKGKVVFDDLDRGFGVRVTATGRKTFIVKYGPESRRQVMTLGVFPDLSVEDARKKASEVRGAVARGEDPAAEKVRQRHAPTFGEWADVYLNEVVARKKRPQEDQRYLAEAVRRWRNLLLAEVTPNDVATLREWFATEGHKTQGNRALASVRACFAEAVRRSLMEENPAARLRPFRENPPRQRVASLDEERRLVEAIEHLEDRPLKNAFLMLMELGLRTSELLAAKWEDLDLDRGVLTLPTTKTGRTQSVPLPDRTVKRLRRLPRLSQWIIPGATPFRQRASLLAAWRRLKASARVTGLNLHDLRRGVGLAVARKHGILAASRVLRHSDVRVTASVYAPFGLDSLREAVEDRAELLPTVETS